jgi:ABC-type transporter Mla subunit MlaD
MTSEVKASLGGTVTEETQNILSVISANFETFDSNFNSLRKRIDDLEKNVIATLKDELQSRDDQIRQLIEGKDEIVKSLADLKHH